MHPLTNIEALIIDMDGVLWEGKQALPGIKPFFATLRKLQLRFVLATNNASLTQQQYIDKLDSMGVTVEANEILTSSMATAHHLAELSDPLSTKLFVIGEQGLHLPLIEQGFTIIDSSHGPEIEKADYVVCGLDRQLSWNIMANASLHLGAGAKFIASNGDTSLPTERGVVLGNGSILAALKAATNISPKIIGKPEAYMYQHAMKILGSSTSNTVAIGDRLDTDILGAINTGIRSIMVLTGISSEPDLANINYQPTVILPGLADITETLLAQATAYNTNE